MLALEGVKDRLPGFKLLSECYGVGTEHEKDLRKKMLLAHLAFINLAIEMIDYYIGPGCCKSN